MLETHIIIGEIMNKIERINNLTLVNGDYYNEIDNYIQPNTIQLVLTDPAFNIADKGKVTKYQGKIYSNKQAWGDAFKDSFTPEEYCEYITKFVTKSYELLMPGGSLVVFIDRKYAGNLINIAEAKGFIYKNLITFVKTNCVPKIRAYNYASATEVAVWLAKPRITGTKTKPLVFNYHRPIKNLRHPDNKLDVVEYHNHFSSNVFFYSIGNKIFGHPTEKYGGQIIPLIEHHSNKGGLIVDFFAGSFAIGYYAELLGRQYIGFEISQDFFDSSVPKIKELLNAPQSKETKERGSETGKEPTGTQGTVAA